MFNFLFLLLGIYIGYKYRPQAKKLLDFVSNGWTWVSNLLNKFSKKDK